MTLTHHYSNPAGRDIFRLRDISSRPDHGFDLAAREPAGYTDLTTSEQLSVAEFIVFLFERRAEPALDRRLEFHMRDHDNRPVTTEFIVPADTPHRYEELSGEERFHVHEFIQFLQRTRA